MGCDDLVLFSRFSFLANFLELKTMKKKQESLWLNEQHVIKRMDFGYFGPYPLNVNEPHFISCFIIRSKVNIFTASMLPISLVMKRVMIFVEYRHSNKRILAMD